MNLRSTVPSESFVGKSPPNCKDTQIQESQEALMDGFTQDNIWLLIGTLVKIVEMSPYI